MSLLRELWNLDLPRSYKDLASDGAGTITLLRGCKKLRQERHHCLDQQIIVTLECTRSTGRGKVKIYAWDRNGTRFQRFSFGRPIPQPARLG